VLAQPSEPRRQAIHSPPRKPDLPESMRGRICSVGLRHQCHNIEQAIRQFPPGSQTFTSSDKFRDAILCADAGPQALLTSPRPLSFHRCRATPKPAASAGLASLRCGFPGSAGHKAALHQRLQLWIAFGCELVPTLDVIDLKSRALPSPLP